MSRLLGINYLRVYYLYILGVYGSLLNVSAHESVLRLWRMDERVLRVQKSLQVAEKLQIKYSQDH